MPTREHPQMVGCERRRLLQAGAAGAGLSLAQWIAPAARADNEPDSVPPQIGDHFAYLSGEKKGQAVRLEDLAPGGPQVQVYPMDPKTGLIRDGSRLNLILLIRLDPADLAEETKERSADGVVAYSGVCTHQGCPVNMWDKNKGALFCSCHGSVYNPKDGADVVGGPAPRSLPAIAVKTENGFPVVASGFTGRVGGTTS